MALLKNLLLKVSNLYSELEMFHLAMPDLVTDQRNLFLIQRL